MPYATQQNLIDRCGSAELLQLTDRSGANSIDAAVVSAALADADATIEGYLAGRYAVPVSPVPPLLVRLACDVTRFLLHGKAADEAVTKGYDDALKMLRDLADGRAVLAGALPAAASAVPSAPPGRVLVAAPDRVASRDAIGDYFR